MGDLVWVQYFFFKTSKDKRFPALDAMTTDDKYFFLVQDTFSRVFACKSFFPEILADTK